MQKKTEKSKKQVEVLPKSRKIFMEDGSESWNIKSEEENRGQGGASAGRPE